MPRFREFFAWRIVASFLLATSAFILLFGLGYYVSYINYQQVSSENNLIQESVNDFERVLENFSCDSSKLIDSSNKLDVVADKLTLLENRFGKKDSRVLEQKKLYSELEKRHFDITSRFNNECDANYLQVLFFYSNRDDAKEYESDRFGFILTTFEREDADRIIIYSYDVDLDSDVVKNLVSKYGVDSAPIVIIGNESFYLSRINQLDRYL